MPTFDHAKLIKLPALWSGKQAFCIVYSSFNTIIAVALHCSNTVKGVHDQLRVNSTPSIPPWPKRHVVPFCSKRNCVYQNSFCFGKLWTFTHPNRSQEAFVSDGLVHRKCQLMWPNRVDLSSYGAVLFTVCGYYAICN